MKGATEAFASFVAETPAESIPSATLDSIRVSLFDAVGTTLAGSAQPVGQIIQRYAAARGGNPESSVLGSGLRLSADQAALANGTMGHALDYDDFGSFGHSAVAMYPAVLAIAELTGASGRQVLEAYALGFEVGYWLCKGGGYNQYERGFHSTAVFGTIAAAGACSRLLGLSTEQTMMAFGIAASEAGGVGRNNGTMTKPMHAGLAASSGVTAALLAREGFTAAPDIFEAKQGFCEAFLGEDRLELKRIVDSLGNPFKHQDTLTIKKYPCCGSNHSALESVLGLMREHSLTYDDIESVEVQAMKYTSAVLRYPDPPTGLNAKFSIHHTVAAAILDGEVRIEHFTDECARDPRMAQARAKVTTEVLARWDPRFMYPGSDANPVVITLSDGRTLTRAVERKDLLGAPRNPWPDENLKDKFRSNARYVLADDDAVQAAVDAWWGMDALDRLDPAIATVCPRRD